MDCLASPRLSTPASAACGGSDKTGEAQEKNKEEDQGVAVEGTGKGRGRAREGGGPVPARRPAGPVRLQGADRS